MSDRAGGSSSSAHRSSSRRSRSRSRSRDRAHERDRKKDRRSRSRTHSRSRERSSKHESKPKKERKDKDREKEKSSGSSRELEKQLKAAKKLLKQGGSAAKDAAAMLDSGMLEQLIAEEKKKAERRAERKQQKDKKQKEKRKKREVSSSSDSSSGSSEDEDDADDKTPAGFLADGVTPRLRPSDFFTRSTEFRVWLHSTHGRHVDDIPSKKSRQLFRQFADAWNAGTLTPNYYKGIDSSTLGAASLTKHKWGFAKKMTEAERLTIATMRDDVDSSTHHHSYQQEFKGQQQPLPPARPAAAAAASSNFNGADRFNKADNKRFNAHQQSVLEELVPKSTGREAQLEKRQQKGSYAHVDKNAGGVDDVADKDLMGSAGNSDYQAMLAKRATTQNKQTSERSAKLEDYKQKEKDKMKAMLAGLGLSDKYPMQ